MYIFYFGQFTGLSYILNAVLGCDRIIKLKLVVEARMLKAFLDGAVGWLMLLMVVDTMFHNCRLMLMM